MTRPRRGIFTSARPSVIVYVSRWFKVLVLLTGPLLYSVLIRVSTAGASRWVDTCHKTHTAHVYTHVHVFVYRASTDTYYIHARARGRTKGLWRPRELPARAPLHTAHSCSPAVAQLSLSD